MPRRPEPSRFTREDQITLADVSWALGVMARIVQIDGTPTYLPIFERLLAERDRRERQADLISRAGEIAGIVRQHIGEPAE